MISFNWVITLPPHLTEDKFDSWYLGIHTKLAQVAHKIVRYSINRRVEPQPEIAHGEFFRIAQEYWETWEDMQACWTHSTGYALLGDGAAHMGLGDGTLPGIALTTHTHFDVAQPAVFSTFKRGYKAREDGTITRFIAFGVAKDGPADIGKWYADACAGLGQDPLLREHVFGTTVGKTLYVGYTMTLPQDGQLSYDWNLELWFDSNEDALRFLSSAPFLEKWNALMARSTDTLAGLFRGQEMLMLNTAMDHKND